MFETVINLKPESAWRPGMTVDKLIAEMDHALQFPGVANSWTMPIKARIDMLSTGIRTPIGIKVFGKDLNEMERLAREIEAVVKTVPGNHLGLRRAQSPAASTQHRTGPRATRALWSFRRRSAGRDRYRAGRRDGDDDRRGRERFGVAVRYPRELRSDPQQIAREVLVPTLDGAMIPLGQVARVEIARGAPGIRTENALLSAYIYVDIRDRDNRRLRCRREAGGGAEDQIPAGYYIAWSGQFENMERQSRR